MGLCLIWMFFGVATLIHPSTEQMMESETHTLYLQNIIRLINNLSQEFKDFDHKMAEQMEGVNEKINDLSTKMTSQEERMKAEMNDIHRNMTMVNMNMTAAVEELDVKIKAEMEGVNENLNDYHQNITNLVKSLNEEYDVKSKELLFIVCCPEGYQKVGGRCIFIRTTKATYEGSNEACLRKEGQLLKLDNKELFDIIVRFIKAKGLNDNHFWVGMDDRDVEGDFRYLDGTPVEVNLWSANEPNDYDIGEDCVHMHKSRGFLLNDISCNLEIGSICEYLY